MKLYARMVSSLWPYKWRVVQVVLLSVLVVVLQVGSLGAMKPLFDTLFATGEVFDTPFWQQDMPSRVSAWLKANVFQDKYRALLIISGFILVTTLLRSIAFYNKAFWSNWLSKRSMADMRRQLFQKLMSQSVTYFDRRKSGVIISRFTNSLSQMQKGMTALLSDIVMEPLMAMGALGLAFLINFRLAAIGMLIFPLNWLVIMVTGRLIRKSTHSSLRRKASMVQTLQKSIDGIRVVKAFVMEGRAQSGFDNANEQAFRYDMRGARAKSILQPIVELFSAGFVILFLLLGGVAVLRAEMTPGDFVAFYAAMVSCYSPIKKVNNAMAEINHSLAGAADVFCEMDRQSEQVDSPDAVSIGSLGESLKLDHVSFGYDDTPVLHSIDLTVSKGEFIALVGPSGAGKTTLVSLVPRLYDVVSGSIMIDGIDIRDIKSDSLRASIGFVTQDPILFHDTISGNIGLGDQNATDAEIEQAARTAHAHEFIEELPAGYDTIVGDRGVLLSGGQRQRIALARVVLRNPSILLLDEPTSALDTESERLIQHAMEHFVSGRTTIVIAHRLSTILHADRIIVMEEGRVVEAGTHDELLAQNGKYNTLYMRQFRPPDRFEARTATGSSS